MRGLRTGEWARLPYCSLRGGLRQSLCVALNQLQDFATSMSCQVKQRQGYSKALRSCSCPTAYLQSLQLPPNSQRFQPSTTECPQLWGSLPQCGGGGHTGQTVLDSESARHFLTEELPVSRGAQQTSALNI